MKDPTDQNAGMGLLISPKCEPVHTDLNQTYKNHGRLAKILSYSENTAGRQTSLVQSPPKRRAQCDDIGLRLALFNVFQCSNLLHQSI